MIRVTNLADYAVVVMVRAAQTDDGRLSAATIAQDAHLPAPTVAKVMSALSRAGLLTSHRGVGGGFCLSRPAAEISVADIVEAVDGPIALTQCVDVTDTDCAIESLCAMRGPWQVINQSVRACLAGVSLADVSQPVFSIAVPAALHQLAE